MSLSIVITTYNHENFIGKCIDSVLEQKDVEISEIVIGNDCSTDKTGEIIQEYADKYDIIKVLPRTKNLGLQKNLQDCFANCCGDYIAICEGDDYWIDSLKCKKMIAAFQRYPQALLCFTNILLLQDGNLLEHAKVYKDKLHEEVTINDVIFPVNLIANFSCCMYRKEVLNVIPSSFYQSGNADWLFNMYALDHSYGIYIKDPCSVYRLHSSSVYSSKESYERLLSKLGVCWKYNQLFDNKYSNELFSFLKKSIIECFNEYQSKIKSLEKMNESLSKQIKSSEYSKEELVSLLNTINQKLENITNILTRIVRMVACVIAEVRQNLFKRIWSYIWHTKKKIKSDKQIERYYLLGVSIFKKVKKVVNYNKNLGEVNYKYIHILHKTIITSNIVKMLNLHFNPAEHAFIFNSGGDEETTGTLWGNNIFYGNVSTLKINPEITKRVIVYGLFSPRLSKYLYNHPKVLSLTYWAIMGGDLYSAPDNEIENEVRKNIAGIITTFDKSEYTKRFGNKKTFDIVYNNPIAQYIEKPYKHVKNDPYKIMINNSTDETTLEMLDILSKYKDENIIITTNLSYETYGQTNVKEQIIQKGKEIYGNKFKPILKWQSPQQYVKFLSSVDIYISNQNRQQGVGNMSALMLLGKKIFVKSATTTYSGFSKMGIKVFDVAAIKKMSFEEFLQEKDTDINRNIQILNKRFSFDYQINLWEKIFND